MVVVVGGGVRDAEAGSDFVLASRVGQEGAGNTTPQEEGEERQIRREEWALGNTEQRPLRIPGTAKVRRDTHAEPSQLQPGLAQAHAPSGPIGPNCRLLNPKDDKEEGEVERRCVQPFPRWLLPGCHPRQEKRATLSHPLPSV